jgi:ribonucleoside-diphosphate reductase alpha chain
VSEIIQEEPKATRAGFHVKGNGSNGHAVKPVEIIPIRSDGNGGGQVVAERKLISTTAIAKLKGYEGDPCTDCGQLTLVRSGTCLKCQTCGATSGCS